MPSAVRLWSLIHYRLLLVSVSLWVLLEYECIYRQYALLSYLLIVTFAYYHLVFFNIIMCA